MKIPRRHCFLHKKSTPMLEKTEGLQKWPYFILLKWRISKKNIWSLGPIRASFIFLLDFNENLSLETSNYDSNYICGMLRNFAESLRNGFAWVVFFYNQKTEKFPQKLKFFWKCAPFCAFLYSFVIIWDTNTAIQRGCCGIFPPRLT